jgi:serine protease Do
MSITALIENLKPENGRRAFGLFFIFCLLAGSPSVAQTSEDPNSSNSLRQFSGSIEALARRVAPSVVEVEASGVGPVDDVDSEAIRITRWRSIGSGVIIDSDGYILTNAHVVSGAERIRVILAAQSTGGLSPRPLNRNTKTVSAQLAGISEEMDLAVLKIDGRGLPTLRLGDQRHVRQGQVVFAFGSPGGLRNSVTMGVISAVGRQPTLDGQISYLQTDAPINNGNSGGPLVDIDGNIVGINTLIMSQ